MTVLQHELDLPARHDLEGLDAVAHLFLHEAEQIDSFLHAAQADHGGSRHIETGKELQYRRGHHAQRPLGADEKLLQVVAGVVLSQRAKSIPERAVVQNHFQTQHEFTHVPVAQRPGAAGIRRHQSTDLATPNASQQHWKLPLVFFGRFADIGKDAAGLDCQRVALRIDLPNPVEARKIEDHGRPLRSRDSATYQARVAALRNDRHIQPRASFHEFHDFLGAAR
ncbi:hypothetical protein D9M68_743200 [compost metagenome]